MAKNKNRQGNPKPNTAITDGTEPPPSDDCEEWTDDDEAAPVTVVPEKAKALPAKGEEHKASFIDRVLDKVGIHTHHESPLETNRDAVEHLKQHHTHEHIGCGHASCPIGATDKAAADIPGKHRKYL